MTDTLSLAERLFPNQGQPSEPRPAASTSLTSYGDDTWKLAQAQKREDAAQQAQAAPQATPQAPQQQPAGDKPQTTFKPEALVSEYSEQNFAVEVQKITADVDVAGDAMASSFVAHARELGLKPEQASQAIQWYQKEAAAQAERDIEAVRAMKDADVHITAAKEILKAHGDPQFMEWLESSGAGNSPQMIRFLSKVRSEMNKMRSQLAEARWSSPALPKRRFP